VIKNLGTQFCSLDEEELSDEKLLKVEGKKEPVGRKKNKTQGSSKDDQEQQNEQEKKE
jgi:hypothetical protein